jgi:hypothetical protein
MLQHQLIQTQHIPAERRISECIIGLREDFSWGITTDTWRVSFEERQPGP